MASASTRKEYVGRNQPFEGERVRLEALARDLDPLTRRWIRERGLAPGWHCLEVGAGLGTVSAWMADEVGSRGRVVASDIDPRFLEDSERANLEVRRLDVRSDEIEQDRYDLVCCRTLLLHLDDPREALRRLVSALRPGGWLLVQEPDVGGVSAEDPDHPDAAEFERIHGKLYDWLEERGIFDARFGRRLRGLLESLDLAEVGCEGITSVVRGGSPEVQIQVQTLAVMEPLMISRGALLQDEYDFLQRLHGDPGFGQLGTAHFGAWGRKREPE